MHLRGQVHHAQHPALSLKALCQVQYVADGLRMRRRAWHQNNDALGLLAPVQIVDRHFHCLIHRFGPVAAATRAQVCEEILELAGGETEVHPFGDELVPFVPVGDNTDTRGRHHAAQRGNELAEPALHGVDDKLHAIGRIDNQHDIEPDLAQPADVVAEPAAEPADRAGEIGELGRDALKVGADCHGRAESAQDRQGRSPHCLDLAPARGRGGLRAGGRYLLHR